MNEMEKVRGLWRKCRLVRASFVLVLLRYGLCRLRHRNVLTSNKVTIYGLANISTSGLLEIGLRYRGFTNCHDRTFLNIKGALTFKGNFSIAKGCRFDIGEHAVATFGVGGYINPNSVFIIMNGISVGDGCAISWGCQFLDEDFHTLHSPGKAGTRDKRIVIGSHVWIGSNVSILKGTIIPDGCVIASGSVVSSVFDTKNALIGGNPARVIREDISWD